MERDPVVKGTRSAFQDAMEHEVIDAVQCLSGGSVASFISDSRVGPDIEIEQFMLAPPKSPAEQLPE
jgi:hypothetical protein